jgi:23S rRNA pseudouridine1911/1915/1917 synthase
MQKQQANILYSFEVSQASPLLVYLNQKLPAKSRSELKSYLAHNQILVNNQAISQYNHPLEAGQSITILKQGQPKKNRPTGLKGIKVLFEDEYILVVDKPAGMLTIATDKQKELTAYWLLSSYIKQADNRNRLFIVHRLDRGTSGLLLFAKDENTQATLQHNWNEAVDERIYIAVLEGSPASPTGKVESYLAENKQYVMYSTKNSSQGKWACTYYEVLKNTPRNSLVQFNLATGRKNQIRVHAQDIGHPVVGDEKYGATTNPIGRLCLHAKTLSFTHPHTGQILQFDSPIPPDFGRLV